VPDSATPAPVPDSATPAPVPDSAGPAPGESVEKHATDRVRDRDEDEAVPREEDSLIDALHTGAEGDPVRVPSSELHHHAMH